MNRVISILAMLAVFGLTAVFALDASTFVLQRADPSRGHLIKGCYTLLDDLFRTSAPNGVLRGLELFSPLVLNPAGLALARVGGSRRND